MAWQAVICATGVLLTAPAMAMADSARFDIPAQPLPAALKAFAEQAHMQLLYRYSAVDHATASPITGDLEKHAALEEMLRGTGLEAVYSAENAAAIRPIRAKTSASTASMADTDPTADATSEGHKSFWDRLRLAQVGQRTTGDASSGEKQSDQTSQEKSDQAKVEEVVITGRYEFLSVDTSGTTNLPLPIEKVPQSISLVSGDFIKAADLKTLDAIAEYTPGAINLGFPTSLTSGSSVKLRGFGAYYATDGISGTGGSYEPDYAIFDRLEIVKGPSSVVYGVSSPGGVVNFVTKSATPQSIDYVYAQAGSWNNYRVEGQVAGALDSEGRVRAIGVAVRDQGDSFIHFMNHAKTTLYGGINFDLTDSVTGYLHGGYERFKGISNDGIPTEADGSPAPLARSFFLGSKDDEFTGSVYHVEGDLNWHATDMLEFSLKGNYENSNTPGSGSYAFGLAANGDFGFGAFRSFEFRTENYGIGMSSIYRFDALGLKNSFVSLGALYQITQSSQTVLNPSATGSSNIFAGEAVIGQAIESLLAGPLTPYTSKTKYPTLTVSAQSVLQLIDPLSLLLGVSYSKPSATTVTNGVAEDFSIGSQISYRAGLTYEFLARTNAYVSFSQSYYPQSLLTVNRTPLPPVTGEQYEGGLKYRSADDRLLLTGALFRINEKHVAQYDQSVNGLDYFKPIGEVAHKGLELQALGQITRQWQINAGYAYLDAKVANDSNTAIIGQMELFLPKQTASVYSTYTLQAGFARGLSFSGGLRYVSSYRTSYDSSTKDIPSYTLVDATLGYTVDKWLVQLNAHNILDKHYFINPNGTLFYGNTVGDPANVALSIRRQF